MASRIKKSFAGIEFSGIVKNETHIGVPRNILRKILNSGKVKCVCTGRYTDDYAGDNDRNFDRGEVPASDLLEYLGESAWVLYLNPTDNKIRFCPMQSLGYDITEVQANSTPTEIKS